MPNVFKRMSGTLLASVALATLGLFVPASAHARPIYDAGCVQAVKAHCAANWQAHGWSSYDECVYEIVAAVCWYPGYEIPGLVSPTANRND